MGIRDIQVFPVRPLLHSESAFYCTSPGVVHAISWAHLIAGVEDPTQCAIVKEAVAGAKRMLARHSNKKEAITPKILSKLVLNFTGADASLSDICTTVTCLMGFCVFFLRFSDMSNVKESDVQFSL